MNIAITIEKLDVRRGGAEVGTVRLIEQLVARGHDIHVFTEAVAEELPERVTVHRLALRWPGVFLRQLTFALKVRQALAKGRYDTSVACGRAFSEAIVWSQNGAHPATVAGASRSYYFNPLRRFLRRYQDYYSPKSSLYCWLERRCFARNPPPYLIAVSRMVAAEHKRYYNLGADLIRVAYYQINLERFSVANARASRKGARAHLALPEDTLAILFVGQNFRRKGVGPLVEAAAQLGKKRSDFCVLVAGGSERQAAPYQRLALRLGCANRMRFLGASSRVDELYAAADVFCLPTFYDTFGMVVLEAMASGLPAITSRYSGVAELITHGTDGLVVGEPENVPALATELERLFDPGLRARLGLAAAQTARRVSQNNPANEIARVVEELASVRRADDALTPTKTVS